MTDLRLYSQLKQIADATNFDLWYIHATFEELAAEYAALAIAKEDRQKLSESNAG